jgi:hypothetical protein
LVTNFYALALGGQYGSGLPADTGGTDPNFLLAQYGAAILDRVNLDRGRVRPSFSVDAAAGLELYHKETHSASFQIRRRTWPTTQMSSSSQACFQEPQLRRREIFRQG